MADSECRHIGKVVPQDGNLFVPYVINCVVMTLLSLTAIIGNILILVSICRAPQFLRQPSYVLLLNLAFADLCVGLFAEPVYLFYKMSYLLNPYSILSCYVGVAFNFLSYFLSSLSLWTVAVISLDRLMALHLHMKYNAIVTKFRVFLLLVSMLILSLVFASMFKWAMDAQNTVFVCLSSLALLIALLSYIRIFQIVRYHQKQISIQLSELSFASAERNRNDLFNMFVIWFLMLLCYLPLICTSILVNLLGRSYSIHLAFNFTTSVMFVNSSVNPVVFCWRIREFRAAVRKTLADVFGFWENHNVSAQEITPSSVIFPEAASSSVAVESSTESPTTATTGEQATTSPTKPTQKFKEIANVTLTEENSLKVVEELKTLTSEETLNGEDTKVTLEILEKVATSDNLLTKNKQNRKEMGQNILEVASSILSEENSDNWGVTTEGENNTSWEISPLQVLKVVENVGLQLGKLLGDNESFVMETTNIEIFEEMAKGDIKNKIFVLNGGTWLERGCHVVEDEPLSVTCACNHLTNFAILMQVKEFHISTHHMKALTVITYVGCGISLFGLVLTLATFLSLETLASERTSIHKNLVVAIGLAQIVFLAGIDATHNPVACKAVALFLHYLYTAAFAWMLCEGVHLYSKVVEINFVIMIMVIRVVITSVSSLQNSGNNSQLEFKRLGLNLVIAFYFRAGLKGMMVLLPLLGLTWVFGIMAISKDTIAFQYLFALLNSLQGLFIFAFHCIGNSEVRVAYKRLHEKRTLAKSLPEHSLSSSHNSREKKRMDSNDSHLTADDDIIVTKTIRSISGRVLISVLIWKCPILSSRDIDVYCMKSFLVSILDPGKRGLNLTSVFVPQNEINIRAGPSHETSVMSSSSSRQERADIDCRENLITKATKTNKPKAYCDVLKPEIFRSCIVL
ncbi:Adhesion G-protein coupled receptor D1 [Acropora cervicornis]|uniref:Adhesion G-protein coupled receptor D1 n=1 Tax=Acropora cervicornis TaxID=6130 RepID=A0AAD9PWR5_ACRCE|nr:Adhesion G-protein coupled receptor D1 [Acropora cervicornis]